MRKLIVLVFSVILTAYFAFSQTSKTENAKINSSTFITSSDNVKLFAKISGNGPVCIFVHGGPGAWSKSFEDMKGNSLERKLKMVYYDQRGSGRSDASVEKNYSLDRMVEDIEDIRRTLGVEKIYLLSHSFGGIIAVNYAKKYPGHLTGLILANSTLSLNDSVERQIKYINKLLQTNFTFSGSDSVLSTLGSAMQELSARKLDYKMLSDDKNAVDMLNSIDNSAKRKRDFAERVWDITEYTNDFTPDTKNINVPVLIITGKKDYAIGVDHYRLFHFPNQKVAIIDGGHLLYYEQSKAFSDAIFSFIKKER